MIFGKCPVCKKKIFFDVAFKNKSDKFECPTCKTKFTQRKFLNAFFYIVCFIACLFLGGLVFYYFPVDNKAIGFILRLLVNIVIFLSLYFVFVPMKLILEKAVEKNIDEPAEGN